MSLPDSYHDLNHAKAHLQEDNAMTTQEKLTRCAALIEKIGRGPVWEEDGSMVRLLYDNRGSFEVEICLNSVWRYHHRPMASMSACRLEKWLRVELREAGCNTHMYQNSGTIITQSGTLGGGTIGQHKDELTALIEAAEEVLVAA